jgi:16S rRNA (guanine(966)-N(2))-methyltransferase RsmD
MRVTGGELAGRRFAAPRGSAVRPTADRVRESLFARLGALDDALVLDLYAGSGALGIEALSRGAAGAVFVDRSAACIATLRRNLEALGLADRAHVHREDAAGAVRRLAAAGRRFHLVLADPPYASDEASRVLDAVAGAGVLAPGGAVVIEVSRRHAPGPRPGLRLVDERRYGDTLVVRYEEGRAGATRPGPEGKGGAGST